MRAFSLFLTLLVPVFLVCVGCDRDGAALLETRLDESKEGGLTETHSRVFDGRDSLRTGPGGPTATKDNFAIVKEFVRIQKVVVRDGEKFFDFVEITDPDNLDPATPLFESRKENPIDAPDGHQVTWGEFSGAEGAVIVECVNKGTRIVTHLSGLIQKGTYSMWIDVFEPVEGSKDLGNRIGRFEYTETDEKGKSKGNVFRASGDGEGHIAGLVAPRMVGTVEISSCMLDDVKAGAYEWRVVGIYHWGFDGTPGIGEENFGTFVEQGGFTFEIEQDEDDEDGEKTIE